jgi:hypothetical protein
MNAPFGDGKLDEDLGIFFAPAVLDGVDGWLRTGTDFMAPVVIANGVTGEFVLGLTATGGPAAPIAAVSTAAIAVLEAQPLRQAVNAARVFALPNPSSCQFVADGRGFGLGDGGTQF